MPPRLEVKRRIRSLTDRYDDAVNGDLTCVAICTRRQTLELKYTASAASNAVARVPSEAERCLGNDLRISHAGTVVPEYFKDNSVKQGCPTGGPRAGSGPRGKLFRPAN